jgi:transposase InsO family protein
VARCTAVDEGHGLGRSGARASLEDDHISRSAGGTAADLVDRQFTATGPHQLEQAICDCCGAAPAVLIQHSDRGTRYVSMRYTERLADEGIAPSVGSRGDCYDDALKESVIGLYKTEVTGRCDRWRTLDVVEFATLEWMDWFNHRRLL